MKGVLRAFYSLLYPALVPQKTTYVTHRAAGSDGGKRSGIDQRYYPSFDAFIDAVHRQLHLSRLYHACSIFGKRNRQGANSLGASCIWLDIDVRNNDSHHRSLTETLAKLAKLEELLGDALIVFTGGGLHVYWPLEEHLSAKEYRRIMGRLKPHFAKLGVKSDDTRTSDISSILRVPGATNEKYGTTNVIMQWPTGLLALDTLEAVARGAADNRHETPRQSVRDASLTAHDVAAVCGQLRILRDSPRDFKEPSWFACASVLKHLNDGEEFFHTWSSAYHEVYKREDAQRKLDTASTIQSCATFEGHHPKGCEGCPFQGKGLNPIDAANTMGALPKVRNPATKRPPLPPLYWLEDGSNRLVSSWSPKGDNSGAHVFAEAPIWVSGRARDAKLKKYTRYTFCDSDGKTGQMYVTQGKEHSMGSLALYCDRVKPLGDHAIYLQYLKHSAAYYSDLCRMAGESEFIKMVLNIGWIRDEDTDELGFNFGYRLITANKEYDVAVMDDDTTLDKLARSLHCKPKEDTAHGEWVLFEDWQTRAQIWLNDALNSHPNRVLFLASFIAPLTYLIPDYGISGTWVHLYGDSGGGKSLAAKAASSVWGTHNVMNTGHGGSKASFNNILKRRPNLPFIVDEVHMTPLGSDPDELHNFAKCVTNGQLGARSDAHGNLREEPPEFATLVLTTGNASLIEKVRELGNRADAVAVEKRIIELRVPGGKHDKPDPKAQKFYEQLAGYTAGAGKMWVRHLLQPGVIDRLVKYVEDYAAPQEFRRQDRFFQLFLALADWTANELRTMPFRNHNDEELHGLIFVWPETITWLRDTLVANVKETSSTEEVAPFEQLVLDFIVNSRNRTLFYEDGLPTRERVTAPKYNTLRADLGEAIMAYDCIEQAYYIEPSALREGLRRAGVKGNIDVRMQALEKAKLTRRRRARIYAEFSTPSTQKYVVPADTIRAWGGDVPEDDADD